MAEEYITKELHAKDIERIDDENNRQNNRIDKLESAVQQIGDLVASVKVLATNIDSMQKELAKQGEKIDKIEDKPAQRWDAVVSGIIAGAIGILIGLFSSGVLH